MPHIHTKPGQHDMTVSAYIVRKKVGEWQCLVHLHRKLGVLMQVGGHIELDETPWQAMAHELEEESGYTLAELAILQPDLAQPRVTGAVTHPLPFMMNTHTAGPAHYHSDTCYAFVAEQPPRAKPKDGESQDVRWLSINDMKALKQANGVAILDDVVDMYAAIIENLFTYKSMPAALFSLDKPL